MILEELADEVVHLLLAVQNGPQQYLQYEDDYQNDEFLQSQPSPEEFWNNNN